MDIVEVLFPFLVRPTKRSLPLPPLLSVLVTLYVFAPGAHYVVIGDVHGVSAPSVCRSVEFLNMVRISSTPRFLSIRLTCNL
ncbi:hypothetical protein DPMN_164880 [Dreissena polymorpha]|uniref:Uncharacterized protein n=1 Tax=Dreissena polymorpha TaxID=45954 RepID=A0A9D4ISR3_DREPO|nr:hypothetical protein DPMN_164880 [Dreissena polymorpha]